MPVQGGQKNVLELFIRNQSDFAVDAPPEERSGRVIIGDDMRLRLRERKQAAAAAISTNGTPTRPTPPAGTPVAGGRAPSPPSTPASGLGTFLEFEPVPGVVDGGPEVAAEHQLPLPPWASGRYEQFRESHAGLHEEIVDWMRYMQPRPAELALRSRLVNRMVDLIQRGPDALFPEARVHVFGSMRTGLLLPASDVDLCVDGITSCHVQTALERISSRLEVVGLAADKPRYIQAKVPIVKFTDKLSGLECDCSVNAIGGRQNTEMVRRLLDQYPQSRPLILIIKTFLRQRKLNEVFTGGLSTYSISLMMIHMLQMFYSSEEQQSLKYKTSLGKLLIDFFHLYGFLLDYNHVALSVRGGGSYLPKQEFPAGRENAAALLRKGQNPLRLAIEDPQNPDNDVSGGSREIQHIQTAFRQAFLQLTAPRAQSRVSYTDHPLTLCRPTLLNRILSIDRDLLVRRDALDEAYEKYLATGPDGQEEHEYVSEFEEDFMPMAGTERGKRPRSPDSGGWNAGSASNPYKRRRF